MKIIENIPQKGEIPTGSILTIGNFDGVHAGHQQIVEKCKQLANDRNSCCVAVTFDPHPVAILHPEKTPGVLTPIDLKAHLLEKFGVDFLIVIKDSLKLLNMSPQSFVDDFINATISPEVIVEGTDFNFGYGRSGNCETLKELGVQKGFEVEIVTPLKVKVENDQAMTCSSSIIRQFLERGKVENSAKLLNRYYRLIGNIVKGRGVGKKLGFPTANLEPLNQVIPYEGVYAGYVSIVDNRQEVLTASQNIPAAFSLGRIKTFSKDHPLLVESHLLNNDPGDIYGKYMAMDFVEKIRNQMRFESQEHLAKQIHIDCDKAKKILK